MAKIGNRTNVPKFNINNKDSIKNIASSDWEKRFLNNVTIQMTKNKPLSDNQLNHLRKIVLDTPLPATDKQIWYIKKLGGDDFEIPDGLTKTAASELISTLKGE